MRFSETAQIASRLLGRRLGASDAGDPASPESATFPMPGRDLTQLRDPCAADAPGVRRQAARLLTKAEADLVREIRFVTAKATSAPAGDPHDDVSLANYNWLAEGASTGSRGTAR